MPFPKLSRECGTCTATIGQQLPYLGMHTFPIEDLNAGLVVSLFRAFY